MPVALELKTVASSGGAQANNCTFPAVSGQTFYLSGFDITGLGATAGSTIQITVTGTSSANTPTYNLVIPAGATTSIGFFPPIRYGEKGMPAAGQNSSVTVNVPSFGAGNTNASVVAFGFYC